MTRIRALALTGLAAAATTLFGIGPLAGPAAACSCASWTDEQFFAHSEVVFVAELVSQQVRSNRPDLTVGTFRVVEVYKGDVPSPQEIETNGSGAGCARGGSWSEGFYFFYSNSSPRGPRLGLSCGYTRYLGTTWDPETLTFVTAPPTPSSSPAPTRTPSPTESASPTASTATPAPPATTPPATTPPADVVATTPAATPPARIPSATPPATLPATASTPPTASTTPAPITSGEVSTSASPVLSGGSDDTTPGTSTLIETDDDDGVGTGVVLLATSTTLAAGGGTALVLRRRGVL